MLHIIDREIYIHRILLPFKIRIGESYFQSTVLPALTFQEILFIRLLEICRRYRHLPPVKIILHLIADDRNVIKIRRHIQAAGKNVICIHNCLRIFHILLIPALQITLHGPVDIQGNTHRLIFLQHILIILRQRSILILQQFDGFCFQRRHG